MFISATVVVLSSSKPPSPALVVVPGEFSGCGGGGCVPHQRLHALTAVTQGRLGVPALLVEVARRQVKLSRETHEVNVLGEIDALAHPVVLRATSFVQAMALHLRSSSCSCCFLKQSISSSSSGLTISSCSASSSGLSVESCSASSSGLSIGF